jgi:chemotaxis protein methyltransferase WspC
MASAIPATPSVLSLPRRALAQNPEESGTDLPAIRRLADQGHYEQALQGLASPAARQSLDPAVHSLAGVLLGALGRKDEAMTRFRQALYLDPSHPESLAHLALLLDESGDALAAARLRGRLAVGAREIPS